MALKRPPPHRIDATPVYVDPEDSAWDMDRVREECRKMREAKAKPERHPVHMYHSGASRYDLGAAYDVLGERRNAAEYLRQGATKFILRRLEWRELYRVGESIARNEGQLLACQLGLVKIDGDGPQIERSDYGLTDESMEELRSWGVGLPLKIGNAVFLASQPLREDEKKA